MLLGEFNVTSTVLGLVEKLRNCLPKQKKTKYGTLVVPIWLEDLSLGSDADLQEAVKEVTRTHHFWGIDDFITDDSYLYLFLSPKEKL